MFERYLNVLFALLWTFQLVDSLFLACRIRLGNPTKAFVALKVTAFTDNRPIYIHLNSICVFHRTDTLTHKSNSRSFLQNCYWLVVAHSTCVVDYFTKFCSFSILNIIYFFQPFLQSVQILLTSHMPPKMPAEPPSLIFASLLNVYYWDHGTIILGQISEKSLAKSLKQNGLKKHPFYISFAENGFQTVKSSLEEHRWKETQSQSMSLAFF